MEPLRRAAFAGVAREDDTKIKEVRVVGCSKVLEKHLTGPGYYLGTRVMRIGPKIQGI